MAPWSGRPRLEDNIQGEIIQSSYLLSPARMIMGKKKDNRNPLLALYENDMCEINKSIQGIFPRSSYSV